MPQTYIPYVYFYPSNPTIPNSQISKQLKESLPDLLSTFYPLAGRLIGNLHVDCNDCGAPFADAEADYNISEAISDPNPKDIEKFLPYKADKHQDFCLAVQATHFLCGGLAVGVLISHKVFDDFSFISFVNTWFSVVRDGSSGAPPPEFDAASYFPPLDVLGSHPPASMVEEEDGSSRLFRFTAETISALRETYSAGGHRPSRVGAVSAFIWTRYMSAAGLSSDPDKICTVRTAVNLRTRADPPLSGGHFGNIIGAAVARPAAGDGGVELAQKLREAVKAVDGGHVAGMMNNSEKQLEEMMSQAAGGGEGGQAGFDFTSICGFPLYEADFGSGRPVWVGVGPGPYKNVAILVDADAESGGGIEASVYLPNQHMDIFETQMKL